MNKTYKVFYFLIIFLSFNFVQAEEFFEYDLIRSEDINNRSNELKNLIEPYTFNLEWTNVTNEEDIKASNFNELFNSVKLLQNDAVFTIFVKGNKISSQVLNENYAEALIVLKNLVPSSCQDLLTKNPSLLNNDGNYLIDIDGPDGASEPILVFCDMTTGGGGWTNLGTSFDNETTFFNTSTFGISATSNSTDLLNGALVSKYNASGQCNENILNLSINSNVLAKLNAEEVKFDSKSYSRGSAQCGGMLRRIEIDGTYVKYGNFANNYLLACSDGSNAWNNYTDTNYWEFSYKMNSTLNNPNIASMWVACGVGYHYLQIRSIMVR